MTAHKNAQVAIEYWTDALTMDKPWEGWEARMQHAVGGIGYGYEWSGWYPLSFHTPLDDEKIQIRRKQKTININGFEVPEPLRESPADGALVFIVRPDYEKLFYSYVFYAEDVGPVYLRSLNKGLMHLTEEAAIKHAEALLSFTKREE